MRVSLGLLLLCVLLLTLSFPPAGQFYFAWVALVPFLLLIRRSTSHRSAFLWAWAAGFAFFSANMWWMWKISAPGYLALMVYCGFYWGLAALIIRGAGLLELRSAALLPEKLSSAASVVLGIVLISCVWTASEFARGNLMTGLPWLFAGHSQTPILAMCQIADTLGAYGVTFWVLLINALVAQTILHRQWRILVPAYTVVLLALSWSLVYGLYRMREPTVPGPTVMVVQADEPQRNDGSKPVEPAARVRFHVNQTLGAIDHNLSTHVDMTAWSETMMPPFNSQFLTQLRLSSSDDAKRILAELLEERHQVEDLASLRKISVLTGAEFINRRETRNSAFFFGPDGYMADDQGQRYDKNHLVPFGEFIPFKRSIPWLYRIFIKLGPQYYEDYELIDGSDNGLTVFQLKDSTATSRWKFVTPICFEDIDSQICSAMFRPGADGQKRADFLVNLTNDGWFGGAENADHLQAAIFRSIENRVPSARSVNTGISGFIDSVGRTSNLIPSHTEGASIMPIRLDSRLTFYTRYGDVFAWVCAIIASVIVLGALLGQRAMVRLGVVLQDNRLDKSNGKV